MPPKRPRQSQLPAPEPAHPVSPTPDRPQLPGGEDQDQEEVDVTERAPPPFYNTTFSAHRVSPLYLGSEPLTQTRLQALSQQIRDKLVGDIIRGVEVGVPAPGEESIIGRAGALERVVIVWVSVADVLGILREEELDGLGEGDGDGDGDGDTAGWWQYVAQLPDKKALHITLQYEMASCTALMLPPLSNTGGDDVPAPAQTRFAVGDANEMDWEPTPNRFLSLPLLLLRMPAPLKTTIADFLSKTFDCRVSPMRLGTRSLVRSWEAWIRSVGLPSREPLARDVVLSLGFHAPPPEKSSSTAPDGVETAGQQHLGLKAIDVIVPAGELRRFVAAGKRLAATGNQQAFSSSKVLKWGWEDDVRKRRTLAGRLYEEGWEWRMGAREGEDQPFTEALGCYLKEHLGLDMFHPGVRVVKIACGGFAMSENRLKVFAPAAEGGLALRGAVLQFLGGLVAKAQMQMVVG
ncbi:hypothetical protein N658DRAFT_499957 [Parathielavia hyrcaniae]|uniref:Siroheme synthase n=1 Tax=Parathielavia hyrcaniae TaxID=113614 RepID=A0AAN6PU82_9PEZI|nr:hypothetical protein N658DRAFT_499957 [Parathielavia hyrcaniae]